MTRPMKVAALCAGYGGLELGLDLAGVDSEVAWYAEIDDTAAAVMAHHHPNVPNLGDLTTISDPPSVDIVTAGFPCQPVSSAGGRKGINDERWLIDDVVGLARRTGARWLILENVSGLYSANDGEALAHVVDALAAHDFDAEWAPLRAAAVGACHRRERWFCVATRNADGVDVTPIRSFPIEGEEPRRTGSHDVARHADGAAAADAGGVGRVPRTRPRESRPPRIGGDGPSDGDRAAALIELPTPLSRDHKGQAGVNRHSPALPDVLERELMPTPTAGDAKASGSKGYTTGHSGTTLTDATTRGLVDFGKYHAAIKRHAELVTGRPPPPPLNGRGRLNPMFVEWMMGLPEGWVTATPGLTRASQLRCLGNGVVPQQAAVAIDELLDRHRLET